MTNVPEFGARFRAELHDLFKWRRDVRRFRRDCLPDGTLDRLFQVASLAPSVGLSEPWRFVVVEDKAARQAVADCFQACNMRALARYEGERAQTYARLKLEGLASAPSHVAVFADPATAQGHGLGRLTMPEAVDYSAVAAIHTMWLAARAEGIGLGWVSILDPAAMTGILRVPPAWKFVAYLCLGYPVVEDDEPALARADWERRRAPIVLSR